MMGMGWILSVWTAVIFVFMVANIWDAFQFPRAVWREAVLWRWCFVFGFLIFGPVSAIVGLVYRTKYRPRLQVIQSVHTITRS